MRIAEEMGVRLNPNIEIYLEALQAPDSRPERSLDPNHMVRAINAVSRYTCDSQVYRAAVQLVMRDAFRLTEVSAPWPAPALMVAIRLYLFRRWTRVSEAGGDAAIEKDVKVLQSMSP